LSASAPKAARNISSGTSSGVSSFGKRDNAVVWPATSLLQDACVPVVIEDEVDIETGLDRLVDPVQKSTRLLMPMPRPAFADDSPKRCTNTELNP
jgi:hypothetical protein